VKEYLKKIPILSNWCKTAQFYRNCYKSRSALLKQIADLDRSPLTEHPCPVCENTNSIQVSLVFEGQVISKLFCTQCLHLFSNWLAADLDRAQELFDYDKETTRMYEQKYLLRQAIKFSKRKENCCFLDFGVGGNIRASIEMRKESPENIFYACDLNKREERSNYFVTYADDNMLSMFDGIASNSVIEHLDNTIQVWRYFNQLLKPIADGGGVMVHSFPSQLHFDWSHWGLKITNHVCLFSKTSLNIVCEKSGFRLIKQGYSTNLRWPILYFQKMIDT